MKQRPLSISILGYLYAISAPLTIAMSYFAWKSPSTLSALAPSYRVEPAMFLAISAITSAMSGVLGIGLLRGKGWARDGMTVLLIANGILGLFLTKAIAASVLGLCMSGLILYFLHRRKARRFFFEL